MSKKVVNGIPTAYAFKNQLGRTLGSWRFRWPDPYIDRICAKLNTAEGFRSVYTLDAINALRSVRRQCYVYGAVICFKERSDLPYVKCLRAAISEQINAVAEHIIGIHRAHDEDVLNQRIFDTFYTDLPTIQHEGAPIGRKLDSGHQLERANSMHLPSGTMEKWLASSSRLGYRNWAETVAKWEKEDMAENGRFMDDPNASMPLSAVQYLDDKERDEYAITIRNGNVYDSEDALYHSGHHKSIIGPGWSIYTVDFEGNFFVGGHTTDQFHHSSFFSGKPIMAAGEIAVNRGRIVGLTNKTGHYKAGPSELYKTLQILSDRGVMLDNIVVTDPFRTSEKWYTGTTALGAQGNLKSIEGNTVPAPPRPIVPLASD